MKTRMSVAGVTLILLAGCSGAATDTVTSTETVTETATETATVEVVSTSVPQECLDALDAADQVILYASDGFTLSGEAMSAAADGFEAAGSFDVAGLEDVADRMIAVNDEMDALSPLMGDAGSDYAAKAEKCRGL